MRTKIPETREEILLFLNQNPVCYMATLENGQPRVRGMFMYRADESGLIFHSGVHKKVAEQVQTGAPVEVCFGGVDLQVRVAGTAEILDDMELKKEIVATRLFIQPWIEKYGYDALLIFRVRDCRVSMWTLNDNFAPTVFREL
ncbi:MAG: pyridoxamine 5'-phosphate oxidase family protein [Lentisphaerae bacterium]|jgi:uncharacterized pyridoxamine 5'-phosphate oxidase family protein|nr:pyridoxamine 5'-phosphate oxidase family protein [Lentisphaerota bacterium]